MLTDYEKEGVRSAINNWIAGKGNIGEYIFNRCAEYTDNDQHPGYFIELINFACSEIVKKYPSISCTNEKCCWNLEGMCSHAKMCPGRNRMKQG